MARPADPGARSALVAAARREFVRSGILKARIEDITQACRLSKGAFYLHFESKEALFQELVEQLGRQIDELRVSREAAYRRLTASRAPRTRAATQAWLERLSAIDMSEDRRLLELLWEWRDVTHVLLQGCQGTEFEGVLWALLDREVVRVEHECKALQRARFMASDAPADVLGLMVVGTYLLVARRLASLASPPDFDHWVRALHALLARATRPTVPGASPRPAARKAGKGARVAARTAARASRKASR